MSAKDCEGHFVDGWVGFYKHKNDLDQGKPQMRTYQGRQSEKFYETFKQPYVPPRPGKAAAPERPESYTWGLGGTLPVGKKYLPVPEAADFKLSQKKFLLPRESEEMGMGVDMGRKAHVYDATGNDRKTWRSQSYTIENQLQRKAKVPEDMRTDSRVIHRMAPPGLKGFMGAEYSVGFFLDSRKDYGFVGHDVVDKATRKSFAQKRSEDEIAEQVALVSSLKDAVDSDAEDGDPEPLAAGE